MSKSTDPQAKADNLRSRLKGQDSLAANSEKKHDLPPVPATRYDLQVFRSIRRIIQAIAIYSRKLEARCQLTAPQLVCLKSVVEHGPTTVSGIARDVFLSPSTVVGILDRLEHRNLAKRTRDAKDRRVVNVVATEAGKRIADEAPSALQDSLAGALQELPELEQATIALSLKRVVDLMEAGHLEAAPILETDQPASARGGAGSNSAAAKVEGTEPMDTGREE